MDLKITKKGIVKFIAGNDRFKKAVEIATKFQQKYPDKKILCVTNRRDELTLPAGVISLSVSFYFSYPVLKYSYDEIIIFDVFEYSKEQKKILNDLVEYYKDMEDLNFIICKDNSKDNCNEEIQLTDKYGWVGEFIIDHNNKKQWTYKLKSCICCQSEYTYKLNGKVQWHVCGDVDNKLDKTVLKYQFERFRCDNCFHESVLESDIIKELVNYYSPNIKHYYNGFCNDKCYIAYQIKNRFKDINKKWVTEKLINY